MNKKILAILLLILGLFVLVLKNPALQSEGWVRKQNLKLTPLGTGREDVKLLLSQRYESPLRERDAGWWATSDQRGPGIGASRIRCSINDFGPFNMTVIWVFDENDKLIEVVAWKTIDLL